MTANIAIGSEASGVPGRGAVRFEARCQFVVARIDAALTWVAVDAGGAVLVPEVTAVGNLEDPACSSMAHWGTALQCVNETVDLEICEGMVVRCVRWATRSPRHS